MTTSKEIRERETESSRELRPDELEIVAGGAYQAYVDIKGQKQGHTK